MLRYRLDSIEQARHHFHETPEHVLFFYPSLFPLRPAEPVILEVGFVDSDQQCAIRGSVVGSAGSEWGGSWLELEAHGIVARLKVAAKMPKRRQRRYPTSVLARVERGESTVVVRIADIGVRGARLAGTAIRASAGDQICIAPLGLDSGVAIRARVAWVRGIEVGVEFTGSSAREREMITALLLDAREGAATAYEATHPVICRCEHGQPPMEPALPRAAHRRSA